MIIIMTYHQELKVIFCNIQSAGLANDLLPVQPQAITKANVNLFSFGP